MKRKKAIIIFLAFVALAGIINCMVVEPALAYKEDSAVAGQDEAHCCFICHSAHHQWAPAGNGMHFPAPLIKADFVPNEGSFYLGSFASSVFHPPQSL